MKEQKKHIPEYHDVWDFCEWNVSLRDKKTCVSVPIAAQF